MYARSSVVLSEICKQRDESGALNALLVCDPGNVE